MDDEFMLSCSIPVAGVTFHLKSNDRLISDDIYAERMKDNPVDPKAVGVWNVDKDTNNTVFCGYFPKEMAAVTDDSQLPRWGKIVWRDEELGIRIRI
jgi:hypothetical protein